MNSTVPPCLSQQIPNSGRSLTRYPFDRIVRLALHVSRIRILFVKGQRPEDGPVSIPLYP